MREATAKLRRLQTSQALDGQRRAMEGLQRLGQSLLLKHERAKEAAQTSIGDNTPREPSNSAAGVEPSMPRQVEKVNVRDVVSRAWGNLPDKLRDQMQSTTPEQFLPKYERVIEDYYQRLAEEPVTRP